MLAGRGGAGLSVEEASGDEGGGVGNGKGAGLTPMGPGADEVRSGIKVLPSAGGLGGGGGVGAGVDIRFGAGFGVVNRVEGGCGVGVVVGGGTGGGKGVTVESIGAGGGAGVGASFGTSGCFTKVGDARGGGVPFTLGSGAFGALMGGAGKEDTIFGPAEGALIADLLEGPEVGDGVLPELASVVGEGGELRGGAAPFPLVWVIGAAGFCSAGDCFVSVERCNVSGAAFSGLFCETAAVALFDASNPVDEEVPGGLVPFSDDGREVGSALFFTMPVFVDPNWLRSIRPVVGGGDELSFSLAGFSSVFFFPGAEFFSATVGPFPAISVGANVEDSPKRDSGETTDFFLSDPGRTGRAFSAGVGELPCEGSVVGLDGGSTGEVGRGAGGGGISISCEFVAARLDGGGDVCSRILSPITAPTRHRNVQVMAIPILCSHFMRGLLCSDGHECGLHPFV